MTHIIFNIFLILYYKLKRLQEHAAVNRSVVSSSLSGAAKNKASIKMGAFLFVYIPRQTKNVVRPSYDGQSLMGQGLRSDSVGASVRELPPTVLGTDEQLGTASCGRRHSYANKFAPES